MTVGQERELNQPPTSSVSPMLLKELANLEEGTATVISSFANLHRYTFVLSQMDELFQDYLVNSAALGKKNKHRTKKSTPPCSGHSLNRYHIQKV